MTNNAIIQTIPAATGLHRVPGFDPMKYLKRTVNAQGEPVLRLELGYKKLWFRLACPNGRMLLNPLRITDQMSIIEAQVFFDRSDTTPTSSFTSTKTAKESPRYIRDAQDEALNEALDNAGFGIQLCDVAEVSESRYGSEIPVSQASAAQANATSAETVKPSAVLTQERKAPENAVVQQQKAALTETEQLKPTASSNEAQDGQTQEVQNCQSVGREVQSHPISTQEASEPSQAVRSAQPKNEGPASADQETATDQRVSREPEASAEMKESDSQPAERKEGLKEVVDLLAQMAKHGGQPNEASTPTQEAPTTDLSAVTSYSADMPVEEICKKMTLDEARAVVVPTGTCKGLTLAQVAERRRSSLKFYMFSMGTVNNVVKAAATLIWNEMELQKAG